MSEHIEDHGLFERLSESMVDPYIDRKMHQARRIAEQLNEYEYTKNEKAELVAELDSDWIYRKHSLIVSGTLWCVSTEKNIIERKVVRDLEVISDGFMFDPERISFDGEHIEGKLDAALALLIKDEERPNERTYAAMHLDDIEHIEYPFPSSELRSQRFRYHAPEEAEDIDCAIFNAKNVGEIFQNLAEVVSLDRDSTEEDDTEEVIDMQSYLNDTMDLDEDLPYRVTILGQVAVMEGGTEARLLDISKPLRRFAVVNQVRMLSQDLSGRTDVGGQRYVPYLDVKIHDSDKHREPRHLMIPFTSIIHAESIRDEV